VEVLPSQVKKKLSEIVEICEEKRKRIIDVMRVILEEFSKSGIQFIVFKTFPLFEYVPTDIDILVKQSDFEKACEILNKVSKAKRVERATLFGHQKGVRFFISEDAKDTVVDLHSRIEWEGKAIQSSSFFLKKVMKEVNGLKIPAPSPVDELKILISHSFYQHEYFTLSDIYWISSLIESIDNFQMREMNEDELSLIALINIRNFILGLGSFQLTNERAIKIGHFIQRLIKPVFFLPLPMSKVAKPLRFLVSVYRRFMFKATKRLPFNENWFDRICARGDGCAQEARKDLLNLVKGGKRCF
jgi:hypothetical protein